mgnify:FL=1
MKIKSFSAATSMEAMRLASEALGRDAVIISTETLEDGQVRITAALEEKEEISFNEDDELKLLDSRTVFDDSIIRECLNYHSVLDLVKERVLSRVRGISKSQKIFDDEKLLTACFKEMFKFSAPLNTPLKIKLFMGTSGSGKSTAIAKTATQAKLKNISACIISTDNVRAGANQQLEAFAQILDVDFMFCKNGRMLFDTVKEVENKYELVLIDTPGINPFIPEDVGKVGAFVEAVSADAILTMASGLNTYEAIEIAEVFTELGARYLMPTRMDLTRRIGSLLSVASCCELGFCSAGVSASIAKGLAEITPRSLARLILE